MEALAFCLLSLCCDVAGQTESFCEYGLIWLLLPIPISTLRK